MNKYQVIMDITIADTDSPPTDWLLPVITAVCEDGETVEIIECKEIA